MTARWRRDEPQFYNVHQLDWEPAREPEVLRGVDARLLSRDPDTGSCSVLARLEPGWRGGVRADGLTLDLVVLTGAVAVEGRRVASGGYAYVPDGAGDAELASEAGAQVVVFANPGLPVVGTPELRVTRLAAEPWHRSVMPTALHGALHKSLRLPDVGDGDVHGGPGGCVRLVILTPGFGDHREHVHGVWEEMLFLGGDLLMPGRGVLAPGSYLGNPAGFWHAPMITAQGSLMLLQTTEPIDQVAREYASGSELVDAYVDDVSWLRPPEQLDWSELGRYHPEALLGPAGLSAGSR